MTSNDVTDISTDINTSSRGIQPLIEDPMAVTQRLSWPVSASLFKVRGNRRILVLGDQHKSLRGTCDRCQEEECATINELIRRLIDWSLNTGTHLDIFAEFPVPSGSSSATASSLGRLEMTYNERVSSLWARARQRILEWLKIDSVFGRHPGYLAEVLYEFRHEFLRRRPDYAERGIRFHCADARVNAVLRAVAMDVRAIAFGATDNPLILDDVKVQATVRFFKAYESVRKVDQVVTALCFSKNLDNDLKSLGLKAPRHALVREDMYTVAHQVWKLTQRDRAHVRRFFGSMLSSNFLSGSSSNISDEQLEASFSEVRETILSKASRMSAGERENVLRQAHGFALILLLIKTLPLMDVYLIARMLRYMSQQPAMSTTIVYAGDAHCANYVRFIKEHFAEEFEEAPCEILRPKRSTLFDANRCVHLSKCSIKSKSKSRSKSRSKTSKPKTKTKTMDSTKSRTKSSKKSSTKSSKKSSTKSRKNKKFWD